jgi:UDP-GlcNAc:undecaprenyl-phosphate/decaprenyl-phosphate GlcNAc-1-phosphate transferase
MKYILAFSVVFAVVYFLIPKLKELSFKIGFTDMPTERKKHKEPVASLGGLGIFIGFLFGYLVFIRPIDNKGIAILLSAFLVLCIGLVDDYYKACGKEFSPLPKMIVQIIAAIIVYRAGIAFNGFNNPFNDQYVYFHKYLAFILSITWIFGVTTVINFIDGMDGLAGGISAISASTLFIVALVKGQSICALMAVIIAAAALGFLRYNKYPAEIFMGDSGATFVGFILGIIALDGAFKQATLISIFIPVLALGVPIFDNIFVVIKRLLNGKPVYKADTSQIHYRLESNGLNKVQVVNILYAVSICLSLVALLILALRL